MRNRTPLVLTASLAAALALPALASANGTLACDRATYTGYPAGPTTGALRLVVDGATFAQAQVTIAPPRAPVPLEYSLTGTHTLELYFDGYGAPLRVAGPVILACGPATPPAPPTPEQAPDGSTPGGVTEGTTPQTTTKEGGRKKPSRVRLGSATSWRTIITRCRIYSARPANGVAWNRVPKIGQVRVKRDAIGRWAGYRDRQRVLVRDGKVVSVTIVRGSFCGQNTPAVTW